MRFAKAWTAIALAVLAAAAAGAGDAPAPRKAGGTIDNDAVWEGRVLVEKTVAVAAGRKLTVRPGTEVLFARGAGLEVSGTLDASGDDARPIRFASAEAKPAPGDWTGIALQGAGAPSVLKGCIVEDAEAVRLVAGPAEVSGCRIRRARTGLVVFKAAEAAIRGNTISEILENGIDCQPESAPTVEGNTIRGCGALGIVVQRSSAAAVTGNTVSGCVDGIWYGAPAPAAERNVLDNNEIGIYMTNTGQGMTVRRNRFVGNRTGLEVEGFSAPVVEANAFDGNRTGIFCTKSSSPEIARNRIAGNGEGISCSQLSTPRIRANEIVRNDAGVVLTLSAYGRINGNNLEGNKIQVRLDNMSHDWEVRVGRKPDRGAMARFQSLASKGRATAGQAPQGEGANAAAGSDAVDATGNWWGEKDTAEMAAKGPAANIGSLVDGYDVPTRRYEGYPGEYAQDRIDYKDWKTSRIPDAGIPGANGEESGK